MYRTVEDRLKPNFRDLLGEPEAALLDSINFSFPRSNDVYDVYASETDGKRMIVVSAGHMVLAQDILNAAIAVQYFKLSPDILVKYVKFRASVMEENVTRARLGQELMPDPIFGQYAGIAEDSWYQDYGMDVSSQRLLIELEEQYLGYVIAHEFGHHVLHHVNNPPSSQQESRSRERAADAFAMKLLVGAKFNPFLPAAGMLFFMASEHNPDLAWSGDHPPAGCRLLDFIAEGLHLSETDREFRNAFENDVPDGPAVLQSLREQLASLSADGTCLPQ